MKNILQMSLKDIGEAIRHEQISPVAVVEALLNRIDLIDPKVNAFVTLVKETALKRARSVVFDLREGFLFGPLQGVPIAVTDNIYTREFPTTMGSELFHHYFPGKDAFVVEQLRSAGAIIMGKVNLHQFGCGLTGDRSSHGAVKNPYKLSRVAGGSSSGAAAAVATCMVFGAIGTDTEGSLRIPASLCGVVGMKPTYSKISKYGMYPVARSLDHVGPITRSVYDNALLLSALDDFDYRDPDYRETRTEDFTYKIGQNVKGKVIGVPTSYFNEGLDKEIEQIYKKTIQILQKLGTRIKPVDLPNMDELLDAQRTIFNAQAYEVHASNVKRNQILYDEEVRNRVLNGKNITMADLAEAKEIQKDYRRKFARIMSEVDTLVTPTVAIKAPLLNDRSVAGTKNEEQHINQELRKFTAPFNILGLPALTVPAGFTSERLPVGMQFVGAAYSESKLYQIGAAFELDANVQTARLAF